MLSYVFILLLEWSVCVFAMVVSFGFLPFGESMPQ